MVETFLLNQSLIPVNHRHRRPAVVHAATAARRSVVDLLGAPRITAGAAVESHTPGTWQAIAAREQRSKAGAMFDAGRGHHGTHSFIMAFDSEDRGVSAHLHPRLPELRHPCSWTTYGRSTASCLIEGSARAPQDPGPRAGIRAGLRRPWPTWAGSAQDAGRRRVPRRWVCLPQAAWTNTGWTASSRKRRRSGAGVGTKGQRLHRHRTWTPPKLVSRAGPILEARNQKNSRSPGANGLKVFTPDGAYEAM